MINLKTTWFKFGLAMILGKCENGYDTMSVVAGPYAYIAPGNPNKSNFLFFLKYSHTFDACKYYFEVQSMISNL